MVLHTKRTRSFPGLPQCAHLRHLVLLVFAAAAGAGETQGPLEELRAAKTAGVCVQLGCGAGTLTAELAQSGNLLVHALESDEKLVRQARQMLSARGLYGQASIEHWPYVGQASSLSGQAGCLPYADNLVNVVVAEQPGSVTDKEILRVLAPRGTAWVRRGPEWTVLRKPWPKDFDEWTHRRHGPDGNMVSGDRAVNVPTGLRWVAGPAEDEGGKKWYYDHLLVTAGGRNFYVFDKSIAARDAFNGRLLWSREIKTPGFKENSVVVSRTSKVAPVASGERLFCVSGGNLAALDTTTGAEAQRYGAVEEPREILLADGVLLVSDRASLRAYSSKDATLLWEYAGEVRRAVAGDGRVFCLAGSGVACLELATGKERWRVYDDKAPLASSCSYQDGVLALERATWRDDGTGCGIAVLSGSDGERLWAKDFKPGMTHYQEARAFFARGSLWLQLEKSKIAAFSPQSGKLRLEWKSCGGHCAAPLATERYFIAPEIEFTDLASGQQARARMTRSACHNPFVPANGLLYTYPLQCECFPLLRGYMALSGPSGRSTARQAGSGAKAKLAAATEAGGTPALPVLAAEDAGRLEKGPAYGHSAPGSAGVPPANGSAGVPPATPAGAQGGAAEEWPMYRHDALRSGSTAAAVNTANLARLWQFQTAVPHDSLLASDWQDNPFVKGPLTAPVAAGGLVLAAVSDEHLLVALDAKTGARRWTFTAGGRIDLPPTVLEDLCLFGAHDGHVYCVGLSDGELVWQFRAAPEERRILAYGQMESPWPVPGSVLTDGGVAYFAAGRHPASDGGVHAFALRARTAEVLWHKTVTDMGVTGWYGGTFPGPQPKSRIKFGVDYEPMDIFVKDGQSVAMSRWCFSLSNGDFKPAPANTNYEPFPGLAVPRGIWNYGVRQTKLVLARPPVVFSAGEMHTGTKTDTALLLAAGELISATADGKLNAGTQSCALDAPAIHDGLIAAYGRIYVSTVNGKLLCLGEHSAAP